MPTSGGAPGILGAVIGRLRSAVRPWAAGAFALGLAVWPPGAAAAGIVYLASAPAARRYPDAGALGLIGVFGALSVALAPHPLASILPWLGWIALGVAFVLVAQRWSRRDAVAGTVGFAAALVLTLAQEWRQRARLGVVRPDGFTVHPNLEAALLLAVLGAVAVGWAATARTVRARLALSIPLAAGAAALVLTGSRGGLLGLVAGAATWLVLYLARFRWGPVVRWTAALVGLTALGALVVVVASPGTHGNAFDNSGFEDGTVPWSLGGASSLVAAPAGASGAGGHAIRLVHDKAGWEPLLSYDGDVRVERGDVWTLSLSVRPQGSASPPVFVRVEARTADGAFVARAGKIGWTTGGESQAGGRMTLPVTPANTWQRVRFTLPPVPEGAATLAVILGSASRTTGAYGLVDAFQLQRGSTATPYAAGGRPGLASLLAPVIQRARLALRDPAVASGGRLQTWWAGVQIAAARPVLGYGPGSGVRVDKEYALDYVPRPLDHFHSFYLKLLIEGGSVTLAAFLGWVGLVAVRLFRRYRAGSRAAAGGLGVLVALLVQSGFDPVLAQSYVAGSLWLALCSAMYGDDRAATQAVAAEAAS